MKRYKLRTGKLRRQDYKKALEFVMEGMQVDKYSESKLFQYAYGTFFLYMELDHTTRLLSLYENNQLIGLLMADIKGERKRFRSLRGKIILFMTQLMMRLFSGNGASSYMEANKDMLRSFEKRTTPDGEINFLAVDRKMRGKGIGGLLVRALKKKEPGKTVYLYTDNNCVYQFYDHRGFTREETREIEMSIQGKTIPLTCMLYSIRL